MFRGFLNLKIIFSLAIRIKRTIKRFLSLPYKIERIQEALGRIETRQCSGSEFGRSEFRVFSQWGEDGIIQHLLSKIPIQKKIFVEFGVEDYKESNTRFLVINNYWDGLIIDGSKKNIASVKEDKIYWASNIKAISSFITKDNINQLIKSHNIIGEIGLLSIDIDGNDFWVWEQINVINPDIVIVEYNSQFGPYANVSIPYSKNFVRGLNNKHISFYGASLTALTNLARRKGYSLVASNNAGNNAFFVRDDLISDFQVLSPVQAYKKACFREAKNSIDGQIEYQSIKERFENIINYKVYNFDKNEIEFIRNINELNPDNFL